MDERDILDMLDRGGDMSDLIDIVGNIIEMVEDNPMMFVEDLKYALLDKCREENCCPVCGTQLDVVGSYNEDRGEFWGRPAYETIYIYGCTDCGYIED